MRILGVNAVFHDPAADRALIDSLKAALAATVEVHELEMDINDPRFAKAMAERLDEFVRVATPAASAGKTG